MTWTDHDTRTLRAQGRCLDCAVDPTLAHDHSAELEQRAADEIERLQARVARLEREYECHPKGGVPGCDCWECLRTRIAALEVERAEVARGLREVSGLAPSQHHSVIAWMISRLAALLERKVEP